VDACTTECSVLRSLSILSWSRWYQVPDFTLKPARGTVGELVETSTEHWALKVLLILLGALIPPPVAATPELWGGYSLPGQEFGYTTLAKTKRELKAQEAEARRKEAEGDDGQLVGQGNHHRLNTLLDNLAKREANILQTVANQDRERRRYQQRKAGLQRRTSNFVRAGSRAASPSPERSASVSPERARC
jgi:hypothetical protein